MRSLNFLLIICVLLAPAAMAQQPFDVKWSNDRLTVRAATAPLADVVAEVARVLDMELVGREKLTGTVSLEFADQPMDKAFAELLAHVNYSIQKRVVGDKAVTVLRVASMARVGNATVDVTEPLHSPALEALVALETADDAEQKEMDADDDPDYLDDLLKEQAEAARLAAEGAFGPKADLEALLKHAQNMNVEAIRLEALKALGKRPGEVALPPLLAALRDESWDVRSAVVGILGAARDPRSLQMVGQSLQSEDRDARLSALRVLALRAQPECLSHLRTFLKAPPRDDEAALREAAQQLINELEWRQQVARERGK
jgi:HEAT repeat protein